MRASTVLPVTCSGAMNVQVPIIWVALLYSADGAVRRLIRPLVHVSVPVMRAVTLLVALLLSPVTWLGGLVSRAD